MSRIRSGRSAWLSWGRTLVNSVQGSSAVIRFTAGHTRTRAAAEGFCAEKGIVLKHDLDEILADPSIDAVAFGGRASFFRL